MDEMSDDVLLEELTKRLLDTRKALHDMMIMNQKIEKLNIKLAESERLKTNFLSNIRNEINNPLTSILGMSQQLSGQAQDAERTRLMARMIYDEAFALDFQLRNIFTAAEIEAGEAQLSPAQTDAEALVRHAAGSFADRAEEKGVRIEVSTSGREASERTFVTDPEKLRLVIANLVANAVEYTPAGRSVRIEAANAEGIFRLSVTDEGSGISEGDRQRLFERFRQLDQGPTKRHKGHGLGLSITKALVEMLGGTVSVTRMEQGGTRFEVAVPESGAAGSDVFSDDGNEFLFESGSSF